ncbi:oxygenase MpaB family protein [Zeaxanthinibacter sp. PT1]|uniref:oxygenase MpaB family protein n=1 Tax=Zeaxanthinibacter TaxID=561554 RepID=UPI00234A15B6|nr:oxygenase MpaB family protein [Zeaxanthinibacter sp. PT1]MDC6350970.1 oxygenase MpaB family protein [Zeaxanthinibacter sp. PT1]
MQYFVEKDSIVREIWGKSDTILFIFAGGAAEFALNKAVDWLYYTGKLPSDPIGRLFSTVNYAKRIVFAPRQEAEKAIATMAKIHENLESSRGYKIPSWAYRDVLYMLIHYSIASYELLERKLSLAEKEEVFNVFYRVGKGMDLQDLPGGYRQWQPDRQTHLQNNLERSAFTKDLYRQYKRQLGPFRYRLLIEAQLLVAPAEVIKLLKFRKTSFLLPAVPLYKLCRKCKLDGLVKTLLLPSEYKKQIAGLDIQ